MTRNDRPLPPQDLDESRLDRARRRREAEGETSLGDEAVAHAQSIPDHRTPGGDEERLDSGGARRDGGDIVHDAADAAGSAAQTGKPMPPGGRSGP
ncbi:hypothetical protein [Salinarimonas ramus]|uniref:Uncharacterized protein n=1 Tax=Salinarimonas ramus TaxID=690164 RepID=A0A917QFB7_9HYPH|nr:hypothetical protein [Salinarimonas ramus]GGK47803.1 hypothetical protein GCM10011322_38560 [Salinarimonas ramus]